jgi:hypothetical protein
MVTPWTLFNWIGGKNRVSSRRRIEQMLRRGQQRRRKSTHLRLHAVTELGVGNGILRKGLLLLLSELVVETVRLTLEELGRRLWGGGASGEKARCSRAR